MAYSVQAQTPGIGYVSWSNVHIVYAGNDYTIADGNSNRKYLYWLLSSPNSLQSSSSYPSLGVTDCIVFLNINGVPVSVLDSSVQHGGLLVEGSVTAHAIAAGAISADHIKAGAVTADKIEAYAISADKLSVNAVEAKHITAGSIEAEKIAAGAITTDALAAGAVTADTIAANTITAANLAANAVTAEKILAGSVGTDQLAANSITAGKIQAAAVTADQIAANAITAKHLLLTDLTNLCFNPSGQYNKDGWDVGVTQRLDDVGGAGAGVYSLLATARDNYHGVPVWISVKPGEELYAECLLYPSAVDVPTAGATVTLAFSATGGAYPTNWVAAGYTNPALTAWQTSSGNITVPTGMNFMRVMVQISKTGGTAGSWWFRNLSVRRRNASTLIVDGSIKANHIDVGAVTTAKLDAGAVTASKLSVSSLSAVTANLGVVTAGRLQNPANTAMLNLDAGAGALLLRAGDYDYTAGGYPVQLFTDGTGRFAKRLASGTWSGSVQLYSETWDSSTMSTIVQNGVTIYIDTGYNTPYDTYNANDFSARIGSGTGSYHQVSSSGIPGVGQFVYAQLTDVSVVRSRATFHSPSDQANNPYGYGNDRIFLAVKVSVQNVAALPANIDSCTLLTMDWALQSTT
jgi:hypothetical protein